MSSRRGDDWLGEESAEVSSSVLSWLQDCRLLYEQTWSKFFFLQIPEELGFIRILYNVF